ncbi:MAG: phytoene desaturase family protein [Candidatus Hodarchaeota archaeon]
MAIDFDVIVIGAGPGGSSCAALLAKEGLKTLLVDKNPRAGGRMMTFYEQGFYYELFPINGVPSRNSHFERILKELEIENEVEIIFPEKIGMILYEDSRGVLRKWDMNTSNISLLRVLGVRLWNIKELYQTMKFLKRLATMSKEDIDKLYDISALDYVSQFKIPKGVYTYILASFGEGAFEMTSDRTSAAEMIKLFQETAKNSGGRYYKKGIGHVFETYAKAVQKLGGTVLMNTRIEKITTQNGRVTGVQLKNGRLFNAPIVVSSAGIRQTILKLVGEEKFSNDYIEWIKGLQSNLACVGFRWIVNKPVLDYPMYVYYPEGCIATYEEFEKMARGEIKPDKSYIYLGTTSVYPGLAPEGKQLIYACMSCLGDPEIDITPYLNYIKEKVRVIKPEIFESIQKTEIFGPATVPSVGNDVILPKQGGESYGIALSIGQAGKPELNGKSPLEGLYYAGCDAGGSGLGTHQAVDSGINVSKLVLEYYTKNIKSEPGFSQAS